MNLEQGSKTAVAPVRYTVGLSDCIAETHSFSDSVLYKVTKQGVSSFVLFHVFWENG